MQASLSTRFIALAAVALGALAASGAAQARTDVHLSIGVPVYAQPAPVYVEPQPVYVQPAPVYVAPRVVYAPAPVYFQGGWREREHWRHERERREWERRQWEHRHGHHGRH